eukprot:820486-Rhodomonas_salina.3
MQPEQNSTTTLRSAWEQCVRVLPTSTRRRKLHLLSRVQRSTKRLSKVLCGNPRLYQDSGTSGVGDTEIVPERGVARS